MNSIAIKLAFELASDKEEHDLYELHETYRLTPAEIEHAVLFLKKNKIIEKNGNIFKLSDSLEVEQLKSLYNALTLRTLELDRQEIEKILDRAKPQTELYKPNLSIIDEILKID